VTWLTLASSPTPVRIAGIELPIGRTNAAKTPATTETAKTAPPAAAPAPATRPDAAKPPPAAPESRPAATAPAEAAHQPPPEAPAAVPPAPAPAPAPPPSPARTAEPAPPPPPPTVKAPAPAPRLPRVAAGPPLRAAPDPALVQDSPGGPLPMVGRDGREPWQVYARPFDASDKRPRIALVIYGLGISAAATEAAIQGLPGAISLAFSPYADDIRTWIGKARAAGHEALLMAPMEPDNYPAFDPGPRALLTTLDPTQNAERLQWILGRATGYIGVMNAMGSRFTTSRRQIAPILRALKSRGLMFLDNRGGGVLGEAAGEVGVPFAASAFFIDEIAARTAIDQRLEDLERLARQAGRTIAMGFPYPVTLERVAAWAQGVESRGFVLAPVSALATRPEKR